MSADKTPLVNKLILVVLVLILGCLIILVVQQSSKPWNQPASSDTASKNEDSTTSVQTEPVSYLPVTNRTIPKPTFAGVTRPSANRTSYRPAAEAPEPLVLPTIGLDNSAYGYPGLPAGALASSYGGATAGQAGISGRVWLSGVPPPEIPIRIEGTTCGGLHLQPLSTRHYVVTHDGGLANVFVYIKEGLENLKFPVPTNQPVLDNKGCLFEPYVMGLQAKQNMKFQNSDPILHNMHVTSRNNKEFNIGLSPKGRVSDRNLVSPSFLSKPEVFVRVKCDVHPWMFAYIGVVSHPFFAVTDAEGTFRFPPGLPEGKYLVAAVHPKAGESVQEITVAANEPRVLNFSLAVPNPQ